jgi:hypothetical protein
MKTVTFDSTTQPGDDIVLMAINAGWDVAFTSVTFRENLDPEVKLALNNHHGLPELGVWGESSWGDARWADEAIGNRLEQLLGIISNGSFPKDRNNLTENELHQLRDAIVLEAHAAHGRIVFVSDDAKAFINQHRREKLETLFQTRILTTAEFQTELIQPKIK